MCTHKCTQIALWRTKLSLIPGSRRRENQLDCLCAERKGLRRWLDAARRQTQYLSLMYFLAPDHIKYNNLIYQITVGVSVEPQIKDAIKLRVQPRVEQQYKTAKQLFFVDDQTTEAALLISLSVRSSQKVVVCVHYGRNRSLFGGANSLFSVARKSRVRGQGSVTFVPVILPRAGFTECVNKCNFQRATNFSLTRAVMFNIKLLSCSLAPLLSHDDYSFLHSIA